jgi:hypothetical protein
LFPSGQNQPPEIHSGDNGDHTEDYSPDHRCLGLSLPQARADESQHETEKEKPDNKMDITDCFE